ncbi:MAG: pyridoxamine 5'-phosphate oxidase family protein [Desertimonas sp.]
MPSRRNQIAMSDDEVSAFLADEKVLNVATIGPTGHPHMVAMWFVMRDGKPTFWTFGKSQKVKNLQRDPKITGLVEAGEEYQELRGVELRGSAELIDDPAEVLAIGLAVAEKYNGPAGVSEAARPFIEAQAAKRIGIAIDVDHVASWDHRKIKGY